MQHQDIFYAQDFIAALLTSSVIFRDQWNSFNKMHQLSPLGADAALPLPPMILINLKRFLGELLFIVSGIFLIYIIYLCADLMRLFLSIIRRL